MHFGMSTEKIFEARRVRVFTREDTATSIVLDVGWRDRELLRPALNFIANQETAVYVDFQEEGLPEEVSGEAAEWLRECVRLDDRFILATTQAGLACRWVPWRLALAEGVLGLERVAVLPVEDYGYFRGNPVVGLYPTIRRSDGEWKVVSPSRRTGPSLRDWLTS